MKKKLVAALALLAAGGLTAGGFSLFRDKNPPVKYHFAPVERGSVVSAVNASGTIKPAVTVLVGAQVAGQIKEILVDFNDEVKAGQVLARLDPEVIAARLAQAEADLNVARGQVEIARGQLKRAESDAENAHAAQLSAEADVEHAQFNVGDAERDLKRKRELAATGDAARIESERAKTASEAASAGLTSTRARLTAATAAYAAAQANVQVARAQIEGAEATVQSREDTVQQARIDLEHTQIRAPIDGVAIERNATVGQQLTAGTLSTALFTIAADLHKMEVHANVDETDIGRIATGQLATFAVDAYPGRTFNGTVVAVRKSGQVVQNVVTYDVAISVENTDLQLFPGMTAGVHIIINQRDGVLKVPNAALRFQPPDTVFKASAGIADGATVSGAKVWRLGEDGRPHPHPMRTGVTDGVFTEVMDGDLAVGQEIIVGATTSAGEAARFGPLKF